MKWKLLSALLFSTVYSTASYSMFCPGNFNVINIGDSIATVEKLCGPPTSKDVTEAPDNSPQEWSYYLQDRNSNLMVPTKAQGTLKTTVAFDADGNVINISVNGIAVSSFNNCGQTVSMGMSRDTVENACGKPTLITKQNQNQPAPPSDPKDMSDKKVTYTYTTTPPVKLIFIRGTLSESSQ